MNCDLHFPVPVWWEHTNINNDYILHLCDKILSIDPVGRKYSNHGGWQSRDIHQGEHPELFPLENKIRSMAKQCFEEIGYINKKPQLHNFWINRNRGRDFNQPHVHPGCILSGVYYVRCTDKSGDVVFPRNSDQGFILSPASQEKETFLNKWGVKYAPKAGTILLFMSHTQHYVEPNEDSQERISIAFNIGF
jgi:uncharacterized protein (TIGR02466 family)